MADSNLNVQQVARNLENEGIEWSNQKIGRVLNALHSLYHSFSLESKDSLRAELSQRCITTKNSEAMLENLVESFETLQKKA